MKSRPARSANSGSPVPECGYQSGDEFYIDIVIPSWEAEYGQTWYLESFCVVQ
ncbi:MAG: hypothetical protein R6U44_05105 [Archaeoglobaceae archaeon]